MAQVQTVTGPIEAEELGTTLIHEHLRNADEAVHNQLPQAGAAKEEPPHEVAPGEDYDIAVGSPIVLTPRSTAAWASRTAISKI